MPTAKSFILDLLSTLRRGTMPVRALVAAAALFGIEENSLRVSLARLLASGQVERDERGCYRLGTGAAPIERRVHSWRTLERRTRSWNGAWLGLCPRRPSLDPRRQRRRAERALRLLGFQRLEPALALRPDNLRGGIESLRTELRSLGLPASDLLFEVRALDAETETRAHSLWDARELLEGYRRSLGLLEASVGRLRRISRERAMVESFLLGGQVIRQLVLDPLLPDPIVSGAGRRSLVEAMGHYDRIGRAAWADFLGRFGIPHLRTPADTRMGETAALITV